MKLGDIAKVHGGYAFKSAEFQETGTPIIRIGNLDGDFVNIDYKICYPEEFSTKHPEFIIDKGDVLVAMSGATVGKIGVFNDDIKALLNQRVGNIKPTGAIDKKVIYYYCKSPLFKKLIKKEAFGSAQPNISAKKLEDFNLSIPDKEKHNELVGVLDKVSKIIEIKKQQIEEYDQLIKSRFVEMFEFVNLQMKQEDWIEIGTVTQIVTGTTPSTRVESNWDGDILWVAPAELNEDSFYVYDTVKKITESGLKSKALTIMPKETVLLSTRAPIGKVAIVGTSMTCNQGFKNFICGDQLNSVYLYSLLKYNKAYLNSIGTGTTFKEISKKSVSKIRIPVPEITLQAQFADFVKQVYKLKFTVQQSLNETQQLFDALMQKYFG